MTETATPARKYFDLEKFMMFAPAPNTDGRRSRLVWSIMNGNPRVVVYTNDPNDREQNGMIMARMDPVTFMAFLDKLEQVVRTPGENGGYIENFTGEWKNNERTGEKVKDSTLYYGKNSEGMVWLMVASANESRPKPRFIFEISDYHSFYKADGTAMTLGESSVTAALSTIRWLRDVFGKLMSDALKTLAEERAQRLNDPTKTNNRKPMPAKNKPSQAVEELNFDDISY